MFGTTSICINRFLINQVLQNRPLDMCLVWTHSYDKDKSRDKDKSENMFHYRLLYNIVNRGQFWFIKLFVTLIGHKTHVITFIYLFSAWLHVWKNKPNLCPFSSSMLFLPPLFLISCVRLVANKTSMICVPRCSISAKYVLSSIFTSFLAYI